MSTFVVTLLGTGSPIPDPHRAGPSTLVEAGGERYLVDVGRAALMRLAGAGVTPGAVTAVLLTHLHSDHVTDLGDLITSTWITSFEPRTLRIVGPPGTAVTVERTIAALELDIRYRMEHHADIDRPPMVEVTEALDGSIDLGGVVSVEAAPTDHRPVQPTVGYRFSHEGNAVVVAGDTVPCAGLDRLCEGADALVHSVIRKDVIAGVDLPRLRDVMDYHSSVEEAADTAARARVGTLVLTHYVPAFPPGGGDDWRALAAARFDGRVEVGDDLHRVEI